MDRRKFLATAGAAIVAPAIPIPAKAEPTVIGVDFAQMPDQTVIHRMLAVQNGAIREIHRVTGIPRYQMGRDTWQDQVDAGLSRIIEVKGLNE